jgi:Glycosyl hydrolase family 115/Glycosyl hydrolase family 67 N-terminus
MSSRHFYGSLTARAIAAGFLTFAMTSLAGAENHSATINANITMVESGEQPPAVQRAVEDLRKDFAKVLGQSPRVETTLDAAGPMAVLIAERSQLPARVPCTTTADTEAFAFSIANVAGTKHKVVCLIGADMRGTIYAIYEFSQSVLGVDPMHLWTDKVPGKRTSTSLPADFAHVFQARRFAIADFLSTTKTCCLVGFPRLPGKRTGISLKVWDNVFETILRLKGNMIVPDTWIFADDAQVEAAAQRGLIINQHHAIPLGVNVARWPNDVPYNFSTHPEILQRAWTNAVATYKPGEEILWCVGLRGLSDAS